jgi:uncharacterized spore protein YtfJ
MQSRVARLTGQELPFAGGSGAGVSVKPVGFLVVRMNDVRLISVSGNQLAERIVDTVPQVMDKVDHMIDKRRRRNGEGKDETEY